MKTPLEIYKILPKTNCKRCFLPSCLAFAAAVVKGEKKIADCPSIDATTASRLSSQDTRRAEPTDSLRAEKVAQLQARFATIDLAAIAGSIGGHFVNGKLSIKCLGKDFFVDPSGTVTSQCHTHAGLTIPLLQYILESNGADPTGNWVQIRDLKDGASRQALFNQRAVTPLQKMADKDPGLFEMLSGLFSARTIASEFDADISMVFHPMPKIPLMICYWMPEDDLGSKLNIFWDETADQHLQADSFFELGVGLVMMFEKIERQHS